MRANLHEPYKLPYTHTHREKTGCFFLIYDAYMYKWRAVRYKWKIVYLKKNKNIFFLMNTPTLCAVRAVKFLMHIAAARRRRRQHPLAAESRTHYLRDLYLICPPPLKSRGVIQTFEYILIAMILQMWCPLISALLIYWSFNKKKLRKQILCIYKIDVFAIVQNNISRNLLSPKYLFIYSLAAATINHSRG